MVGRERCRHVLEGENRGRGRRAAEEGMARTVGWAVDSLSVLTATPCSSYPPRPPFLISPHPAPLTRPLTAPIIRPYCNVCVSPEAQESSQHKADT